MTRWFPVSLASGLALLLVASSASAQDPAGPPVQTPATQAPPGRGGQPQRLQVVRRRTQRARAMMLRELAMLVNATPVNDQAIAAKLKEVDDLGDRSQQEIRLAYAEIDQVLTPRQRALFRVFEERMEQRKLDLMIRARQQVRQPVTPGAPPAAAQGRRSGGGV